jgi:hypothetical protein
VFLIFWVCSSAARVGGLGFFKLVLDGFTVERESLHYSDLAIDLRSVESRQEKGGVARLERYVEAAVWPVQGWPDALKTAKKSCKKLQKATKNQRFRT